MMDKDNLITNRDGTCAKCIKAGVCQYLAKNIGYLQTMLKDMYKDVIIDEACDVLALHCPYYKPEIQKESE
jgi:hypothetical protein